MTRLRNATHRLLGRLSGNESLLGAAIAFTVRVTAAILAYAVQVFLARMLDLGDYGIYVTLWTWLIVVSHVATFGFCDSPVRFVPRYTERNQIHWAVGFLKTGYWAVSLGSVLLAAIGAALLWFFGHLLPPDYLIPLFVLAIGLPFLALEFYTAAAARGFGWVLLTTLPGYVLRPALMAAGVYGAWAMGYQPDATMVLAIALAVTAGLVLAQAFIIWWRIRRRYGPVTRGAPAKLWLFASLPLVFLNGMDELYVYSDILILGFLVAPEQVSIYFAALKSMSLAAFIQYAFMLVAARDFSLANAMRDRAELQHRIATATRWTFCLSVPGVAVTLAASYPLLALFGPAFTAGIPVMAVIGLGLIARASSGPAADLLIVMGHHRANMVIAAACLAFNIAASIALVPFYGILGVAFATATAYALRAAMLVVATKRLTGLWALVDLTPVMQWPARARHAAAGG